MMMGTGGSAVVGRLLGEGKTREAWGAFSSIVCCVAVVGLVGAVCGIAFIEPVARLLGADDEMLPLAATYGRIVFLSLLMLQYVFEMFSATSGKPGLGLAASLVAGATNIALDALFLLVFGWGIAAAALATSIAAYAEGIFMLVMFGRGRAGALRLVRPSAYARLLARAAFNGVSGMVGMMAASVVAVAYNWQLMRLLGQDGVAAYAVIEYASMFIGTALGGFTDGMAPLMSYQHGAGNDAEKHSLFRRGLAVVPALDLVSFLLAQALAYPLAYVFTSYDQELLQLSTHAFRVYSVAFLLTGLTYFGSALFTAVENGAVSAVISFVHMLVFEVGSVLLLPVLVGAEGIWWAITVAEVAASALACALVLRFGRRYGWLGRGGAR